MCNLDAGYLGSVPETSQADNLGVIFSGVLAPLVLREAKNKSLSPALSGTRRTCLKSQHQNRA